MNLDDDQLHAALAAATEMIVARRRAGRPIPAGILRLHFALTCYMSANGPDADDQGAQSDPDQWITAAEAAKHLGCTARHVRRLHRDLDGRRHGRQHLFPRQTVLEYAKSRRPQAC